MTTEAETAIAKRTESLASSGLVLHRNALIELAIFFFAAIVVQSTLLEPGRLAALQPHLFWIPVVLVSLQYGTADGIAAATAAILTQWVLGWPGWQADEDYVAYMSRTLHQPMLWLGAAIVIGEFRLRQLSENARLRENCDDLIHQRELLSGHLGEVQKRVDRLEAALAARRADRSRQLIDGLAELRIVSRHDVRFERALATCAEILLDTDGLSLFELRDDWLTAVLRVGSSAGLLARQRFGPDELLHRRIVHDRAGLGVSRPEDHDLLGDRGMFAAPIVSTRTGEVKGMLMIEHMVPTQDVLAMEARLIALCRHLANVFD